MSKREKVLEELKAIIKGEDHAELLWEGFCVDSEVVEGGQFKTVQVNLSTSLRWQDTYEIITRTPDGRFFQWTAQESFSASDENEDSGFGDVELTEMECHERIAIVIDYVKKED